MIRCRNHTGLLFLCLLALCAGCGKKDRAGEEAGERSGEKAGAEEDVSAKALPVPEGPKIDGQCFDVKLDRFGDVTFASYAPDPQLPMGDAVFGLEKDGVLIYQFPPVMEGNRRPQQNFLGIQEIGFPDYDGDGCKDVAVLAEYETLTNPEAQDTVLEIRLYRSCPEEEDFVLDTDRMDVLNRNQWNHTLEEAMDHMGEAGQRLLLNYLTDLAEDGD